jgi:gas vesicle protein
MDEYKTFGEYRSSEKNSVSTALTFLFIGLGIGTIVALLFAPQAGKKTRKVLRRRYEDALDAVDELRDQAGEYVDRGRDFVERGRDRGKDFVERGRDFARDARERVSPIARRFRD